MRRSVAATFTAATVILCGAGAAQAKSVKGVVVDRSAVGKSFVVATKKAKLVTVNGASVPKIGSRVALRGRKAANGEFAAKRIRTRGTVRRVKARGTVSVSGRNGYLVSGKSATIGVSRSAKLARAASTETGPNVGDVVVVNLKIDGAGDLLERAVKIVGQDWEFSVEGVIQSIDTAARTLMIAPEEWEFESDDEKSSYERDENSDASSAMFDDSGLLIEVPVAFDLSSCRVGDEVEVEVEYDAEEGYSATEVECESDDEDEDDEKDEDESDQD